MLRGNQVGVSRMTVKLCQLLWKETGEGANPEQRQELMGDTQGSTEGGGQEFEAESVLCCSSTAVCGVRATNRDLGLRSFQTRVAEK